MAASFNILFPSEFSLYGVSSLDAYSLHSSEGAPVAVLEAEPQVVVRLSGVGGSTAPSSTGHTTSLLLPALLTVDNLGGFLVLESAVFSGVYQIADVLSSGTSSIVRLDKPVPQDVEGIEWSLTSGAQGVSLTVEGATLGAAYVVTTAGLKTKVGLSQSLTLSGTATGTPPSLVQVSVNDEGYLLAEFDRPITCDPVDVLKALTLTGPTAVSFLAARSQGSSALVFETAGLRTGSYVVSFDSTKVWDCYENSCGPFTPTSVNVVTPLRYRSIYTNRGPIAKPPLVLQSGTAARVESYQTLSLPGLVAAPSLVGRYVRLSGSPGNNGLHKIVRVGTTNLVTVEARLAYPDANSGTITWAVINPRDGLIADTPSDVVVRVNGVATTPLEVRGLRGQIVLAEPPASSATVEVDYYWTENPTVEMRDAGSYSFVSNSSPSRSLKGERIYPYRVVLPVPSTYVEDNLLAPLPQPLKRGLKYRAFERAYSALTNDPYLLRSNVPNHRVGWPSTERVLTESVTYYEATVLPELDASPWTREGSGTASVSGGVLSVGGLSYWSKDQDFSFPHICSLAWYMRETNTAPVRDGVWSGALTGFSDGVNVFVVGFLVVSGVRCVGFLKAGVEGDLANPASWIGGLTSEGAQTGAAAPFDWSEYHSYRLFKSTNGHVYLFVDGNVLPLLDLTPGSAPLTGDTGVPLDTLQGVFFGQASEVAVTTTSWEFVRYSVQPLLATQTEASVFVTYDGDVLPESDTSPWTPLGVGGVAALNSGHLELSDVRTSSVEEGLTQGAFLGYVKAEPLLTSKTQYSVEADIQGLWSTRGMDSDALTLAVSDGNVLSQVSLLSEEVSSSLSYGGGVLPEAETSTVWERLGDQSATMSGRDLVLTDTSSTDGIVYFADDVVSALSPTRDYIVESRLAVETYTVDPSGFAGVMVSAFDGQRAVGWLFRMVAGQPEVALHSEGSIIGSFPFDWRGSARTYRLRKSTSGNLVTLFADGLYIGSAAYTVFASQPSSIGVLSFGSATPISVSAQSRVVWHHCNAWSYNPSRMFIGLWNGGASGSLMDYHLPTKSVGQAIVQGNTLVDSQANFTAMGVQPGDRLIVRSGINEGLWEVASLINSASLTLTEPWLPGSTHVDYEILKPLDWSSRRVIRIVKSNENEVEVQVDEVSEIRTVYGITSLPSVEGSWLWSVMSGVSSVAFGSFSPEALTQSSWYHVRYGFSVSEEAGKVVPPHHVLNQWNTVESPERLTTTVPHTRIGFQTCSVGVTSSAEPDFLTLPSVPAHTSLNQGTPLVPATQSWEVAGEHALSLYPAAATAPLNTASAYLTYNPDVPRSVLYTGLKVFEDTSGEEGLLQPFKDTPGFRLGSVQFIGVPELSYDGTALPENTVSPTPWVQLSDDPAQVSAVVGSGLLHYGTTGVTKTTYSNLTPLIGTPSLETEVIFQLRFEVDASFGTTDSQVRFGVETQQLSLGVGFITQATGERYVNVYDLGSNVVLGYATFDYLDGLAHTYRLVLRPSEGVVDIYIT